MDLVPDTLAFKLIARVGLGNPRDRSHRWVAHPLRCCVRTRLTCGAVRDHVNENTGDWHWCARRSVDTRELKFMRLYTADRSSRIKSNIIVQSSTPQTRTGCHPKILMRACHCGRYRDMRIFIRCDFLCEGTSS
jgi:hypothetical protein